MIKLLQYIYAAYVILLVATLFTIMIIIYVPLLLIRDDRRRMRIIYFFNKLFLKWIFGTFSGVRVKVEGREKINDTKTYAFCPNHSNMLDIPFTASCIEMYYKPLVKKELMSFPLLGPLLKMTSLGVDRKSPESRKKTAELMMQKMKEGMSLLIFPEGTRNRTNEPTKDFYDGAFKTAIAAQASIAPIALINIRGLQTTSSILIKPGLVTMRFLDPISTVGMTDADTEVLKNKTKEAINEVLRKEDSFYKLAH